MLQADHNPIDTTVPATHERGTRARGPPRSSKKSSGSELQGERGIARDSRQCHPTPPPPPLTQAHRSNECEQINAHDARRHAPDGCDVALQESRRKGDLVCGRRALLVLGGQDERDLRPVPGHVVLPVVQREVVDDRPEEEDEKDDVGEEIRQEPARWAVLCKRTVVSGAVAGSLAQVGGGAGWTGIPTQHILSPARLRDAKMPIDDTSVMSSATPRRVIATS